MEEILRMLFEKVPIRLTSTPYAVEKYATKVSISRLERIPSWDMSMETISPAMDGGAEGIIVTGANDGTKDGVVLINKNISQPTKFAVTVGGFDR